MGPFAKYLQDCDIVARYSLPNSPQQNGVTERCLKEMMSVMSMSNLPENLWAESIKTAVYICNRVLSKSIPKTSFEF